MQQPIIPTIKRSSSPAPQTGNANQIEMMMQTMLQMQQQMKELNSQNEMLALKNKDLEEKLASKTASRLSRMSSNKISNIASPTAELLSVKCFDQSNGQSSIVPQPTDKHTLEQNSFNEAQFIDFSKPEGSNEGASKVGPQSEQDNKQTNEISEFCNISSKNDDTSKPDQAETDQINMSNQIKLKEPNSETKCDSTVKVTTNEIAIPTKSETKVSTPVQVIVDKSSKPTVSMS